MYRLTYVSNATRRTSPPLFLSGWITSSVSTKDRGRAPMPKISEFFGIAIYIYYREHMPPHFHAIYGDDEAWIEIDNLSVLSGRLAPRAMGMIIEWASLHQEELRRVWAQAMAHEPLDKIEPLK
jgi:hypothetical protein